MLEILHASASGLQQVLTWSALSLMLLGILIGFTVGILPGLGGATTLALMLPFIVRMNAYEAFAFLLGMAAVTNTTGDITSILFGVPGEPTTAATVVDGHPMAVKGAAGRALGAALTSSLVGAVFGAVALALGVPLVRPLILGFGSPEFFMLAILGLTFVAALSGGAVLRGLAGACLGLFLSTVGIAQVTGIQRFTFGHLFLWDGVGLIPITIGFFAIPEVIDLVVRGQGVARGEVEKLGGVLEGVKDTFRHLGLVVRCSLIGAFTGIIPGLGGATSQWLAYAHAVQSSEDRERFGKGAVEGVLGPGAANNSILGGHLITTLAFGVPVSVMMAILLGAFFMQGLVPGPDMLVPAPKGHLDLTFSFVWTIILANAIAVGVSFLFLEQLVKVTQLRAGLLIPFILLLVYLGAFTEKNSFPDLVLVFGFGVLGWVMQRVEWPRPPLILGLVLGPLAENRLFLSVDNYGAAWLLRPGVLVLGAVTLAGAAYPVLQERRRRRRAAAAAPGAAAGTEERGPPAADRRGAAFSFGLAAVTALALLYSRKFNVRAGLFPWTVGLPLLAFSLAQLVLDLRGRGRPRAAGHPGGEAEPALPADAGRRTARTFAWILGYLLAIWLLGFPFGGPLCAFVHLRLEAQEKPALSLVLALAAFAFLYGVFGRLLHVPFPPGALIGWLGLGE